MTSGYFTDQYYQGEVLQTAEDDVALDYNDLCSPNSTASNLGADGLGYGSSFQWEPEMSPDSPTAKSGTATSNEKKEAAKRRRRDRYKNCSESVLNRRREQNRAAQRAYRERKDQRVRELEEQLAAVHREHSSLAQAYKVLASEHNHGRLQYVVSSSGAPAREIMEDDMLLDHMLYDLTAGLGDQGPPSHM